MYKKCGKSELYIGVKLSHPCIGVRENNRFCEVRRLIKRPLEDMCTVSDARECA